MFFSFFNKYICLYICLWMKKNLNHTLTIDLPFQTFAVGLLIGFIRLALFLRAPEMLSSSKSRISIFHMHLTLFVRRMISHSSIGKYRHLVN